jgi:hypothetical protein
MPYRDSMSSLRARERAVRRELAEKLRELDDIINDIDYLKPRLQLRVASPCSADWSAMEGDDRARLCAQCEQTVYNLSVLTHDEAVELIRAKEGKLCVRFYQRPDGTVLTSDCPVGRRRRRRRVAIAAGAGGILAIAAAGYRETTQATLGKIAHPRAERASPIETDVVMGDPAPLPLTELRGRLVRPKTR